MECAMREKIDSLADDILNAMGISAPVDNICDVVNSLGGKVVEKEDVDFTDEGRLERNLENYEFYITIPSSQSSERKNFTIAHELGHLFLHMGYLIAPDLWEKTRDKTFFRGGDSICEQQANEFAAAFLMPKDAYGDVLKKNSDGNMVYIAKVAEYFHVSIDAAIYRGKRLGYLQW